MKFDIAQAIDLLRDQADRAAQGDFDPQWAEIVQHFSETCLQLPKTHIAFLGTAMLAKALNLDADVFSIKAGNTNPRAYSARSLGHGALVPYAVELGINLGVTGREPLNNQPYFRFDRMSREIVVHPTAKPLIEELCNILERLEQIADIQQARAALRAFIHVRRQYMPKYQEITTTDQDMSTISLIVAISKFVGENSEGGKRAQAVVAGLMDVFAGPKNVVTSRINDPDRHLSGDVGVRSDKDPSKWERIFEVRDKQVSQSDVYLFADKSLAADVKEAAMIAVASGQEDVQFEEPKLWAFRRGLSLSIFYGWPSFVEQVLFWCDQPQHQAARLSTSLIYDRLVAMEVSVEGVQTWVDLTKPVSIS